MVPNRAPGRTAVRMALLVLSALTCARCRAVDRSGSGGAAAAPQYEAAFGGSRAYLHARGFAPGWTVDIYRDRMVYVGRYGEERVVTPAPARVREAHGEGMTYRAEASGYDLRVRVIEEPCRGPGGGPPSELTVYLTVDGQRYRGCGTRV